VTNGTTSNVEKGGRMAIKVDVACMTETKIQTNHETNRGDSCIVLETQSDVS